MWKMKVEVGLFVLLLDESNYSIFVTVSFKILKRVFTGQ